MGTSVPRLVRVGPGFSRGIASVAGMARSRNKVPLLLPHLDAALIGGAVKQLAWYSHRSSDLVILVSRCVAGVYDYLFGGIGGQGEMTALE